jgi:hypothetical protein
MGGLGLRTSPPRRAADVTGESDDGGQRKSGTHECAPCGATGKDDSEHDGKCRYCKGSGQHRFTTSGGPDEAA